MENHHHHPASGDEIGTAIDLSSATDLLHASHDHGHTHGNDHHHEHTESILRLKTAEGHLRGIQRMLEQDVYCIDVIRQIQAVQAALNKISVSILNQHLNTCVITAVRGEDPQERERVLKEIVEVFETKSKI